VGLLPVCFSGSEQISSSKSTRTLQSCEHGGGGRRPGAGLDPAWTMTRAPYPLHSLLPHPSSTPPYLETPGDCGGQGTWRQTRSVTRTVLACCLPTRNLRQHFSLVEHHAPRTPTAVRLKRHQTRRGAGSPGPAQPNTRAGSDTDAYGSLSSGVHLEAVTRPDPWHPVKSTVTAALVRDKTLWIGSLLKLPKHSVARTLLEKPHSTKKKLARGCARIAIMPGGMDSTGLAVGLKKGFIVEKRKLPVKPSTRKGVRALDSPPLPCVRANKPYLGRFALCAVRACSWGVRAEPEQLAGSQTPPMQNTVDRPWPGQRRCTATGAPCSHREAPYGSRSSAAEGSVGRRNARQGGTMGGAVHRAGSGALVLRVPGEPAVRGQGAIAGELLDWMWALVSVGIDEVRDADERACLCCVQQKLGKQVKLVRDIVREIAGVSPLERRGMELLKNGRDKRVLKLCKKRVRYISPSHPAHPSVSMHFFYPLCSKSLFRQRGAPTFPVQKKNLLWGKKECGGITGGGSL
jgi:hypothetical protein